MLLNITSGTRKHRIIILNKPLFDEEISISCILKEYLVTFLYTQLIKNFTNRTHKGSLQECSTSSCNIAHLLILSVTNHCAIDIGFNGIAKDYIRIYLRNHFSVKANKFQIFYRIYPTTINFSLNNMTSKIFKILIFITFWK